MKKTIIKVKNLSKVYRLYDKSIDRLKEAFSIKKNKYHRDYYALENINFEVYKGEIFGIIGSNGSGKSTLLKLLTGILSPSDGDVEVKGKISALLELGAGFNPEYTGIENIYLNGLMSGFSKKEVDAKIEEIIGFAEIGDFINQPVKTYSSGMFARLAFSVAINIEPEILIIDEALSVGDLFFQNKCFRKFEELIKKGVTILFVSHDISTMKLMCNRTLWIEKGKMKALDTSENVCNEYMDYQRILMNNNVDKEKFVDKKDQIQICTIENLGHVDFPKIKAQNTRFDDSGLDILSCCVVDDQNNITYVLQTSRKYTTRVLIQFNRNIENVIVGFVFENSKGLPIFDINNYISTEKTFKGEKDSLIEIEFSYILPKIMKGNYIISVAVADGTQTNHVMLTWLHGIFSVSVINNGYNSSFIEIDSSVNVISKNKDTINIYDSEL